MTLSEAKQTLGVSDGYSLQEAKSARNSLAKRYHPDVNDDPKADEILKRVNEAYQLLVDSFDAEQERMRVKQAAKQERARQAAERERRRQAAERERARKAEEERRKAAAEEERKRQAAEDERRRKAVERERAWKAEEERRKAAAREEVLRELERVRREAEQREKLEREKLEREKLEQDYLKADEAATYANTAAEHSKVAELFKALGSYRDSESRSAFHSGIADEKRIYEQREAEAKSKRAIALPIMSTTAASIAILVVSYICSGPIALGASLMLFGWMVPFSGYVLLRHKIYDADACRQFGRFGFGLPFAEALAVSTIGPHSMDAEVIKQVLILLVASQCVGSIGCMLSAKTESSMTLKRILACASFAFMIMGISKLVAA